MLSFYQKHEKIILALFRLILAVIIGFLISRVPLDSLEAYLYDARFRLRPDPAPSQHLHLIMT
ncbi:MAG: hypothetical protein ACK5P6_09935, partial [Pseudobdellovibrionaceae bacterium]